MSSYYWTFCCETWVSRNGRFPTVKKVFFDESIYGAVRDELPVIAIAGALTLFDSSGYDWALHNMGMIDRRDGKYRAVILKTPPEDRYFQVSFDRDSRWHFLAAESRPRRLSFHGDERGPREFLHKSLEGAFGEEPVRLARELWSELADDLGRHQTDEVQEAIRLRMRQRRDEKLP